MSIRTKAACQRSIKTDGFSETLYRLGKMVEDRPGVLHTRYGPKHNTDERPFEGLSLNCRPNMDCANRLQEFAAEARERMGPRKWRELNKEWESEA